jgi:glycosyltransferase involved in cell wall biosynthesis
MRASPFTCAQGAATAALLVRLARGRRRRAPLRAGKSPPPEATISAVIPARDEARRIGPCLDGLREDPDVAEILVVDDRSSDATAQVARDGGARVIVGAPLPDGRKGKAWALQQGLDAATGDVVVFLDADARPRPGLVRELAHVLREIDLVTAGPRFHCAGAGAPLLHPAMGARSPMPATTHSMPALASFHLIRYARESAPRVVADGPRPPRPAPHARSALLAAARHRSRRNDDARRRPASLGAMRGLGRRGVA